MKVCGLSAQLGEDVQTKTSSNLVTLDVLKQLAAQNDIHLLPSAIDVCHRLSSDDNAPIIIRFESKSDRYNFVAQKEKLKNITSANIDLSSIKVPKNIQTILDQRKKEGKTGPRSNRGGYHNVARRDAKAESGEPTSIFLQDHLTQRNKDLLKEAKTALRDHFQFPGYVMDGQIRSRRAENDKYFTIKCSADIRRLVVSSQQTKPAVPPKPS